LVTIMRALQFLCSRKIILGEIIGTGRKAGK
jgi:hypothetical protein